MVSGAVEDVVVLSGRSKRLEQAAVKAVRQWQYEPVRLNGEPASFRVVVHVPFRLPRRFKKRAGRIGACKWTEPPKRFHQYASGREP
jgi:TonB family protein